VDNGGFPAPMYFYDACTRVWRAREKRSGTGQTMRAEYPPANVNRAATWEGSWEKPLADWIVATGVGLLRPGKQDYEEERIEGNDGW
jgi:hypothetical protein